MSDKGIRPNPNKIKAVSEFPVPEKVKDVRSFLGLATYYRRFVKDFARIARPLNNLTKKSVKFHWNKDCQSAFDQLKRALVSAPTLAYPDFTLPFHVYTDASSDAIGMALGQIHDGKDVAIAYGGRDLSSAEKNYSATECEALAIVQALKYYLPYLHGRHFVIHTDHHALKWLMNIKEPTGRLARWSLLIQQYDFEIRHRAGKSNGNADALSRRSYGTLELNALDTPGVQTEKLFENYIFNIISYFSFNPRCLQKENEHCFLEQDQS